MCALGKTLSIENYATALSSVFYPILGCRALQGWTGKARCMSEPVRKTYGCLY